MPRPATGVCRSFIQTLWRFELTYQLDHEGLNLAAKQHEIGWLLHLEISPMLARNMFSLAVFSAHNTHFDDIFTAFVRLSGGGGTRAGDQRSY